MSVNTQTTNHRLVTKTIEGQEAPTLNHSLLFILQREPLSLEQVLQPLLQPLSLLSCRHDE